MTVLLLILDILAVIIAGVVFFLTVAYLAREICTPRQQPRTWGDITPRKEPWT